MEEVLKNGEKRKVSDDRGEEMCITHMLSLLFDFFLVPKNLILQSVLHLEFHVLQKSGLGCVS